MSTIAENLARIQQAKADIKTAIEAKGVTVPSSATIDTYDDYVSQISGGGGGNSGLTRYVSGTPYCSGDDQVVDVQNQISVDSGASWVNSGSQYTVIVEAGACGGGLIQIPQGTDMSQYYGRYVSRIKLDDATVSTSNAKIFNWPNQITIGTWYTQGVGEFSSCIPSSNYTPFDCTPSSPVLFDYFNDGNNSTINPFTNLQIEWV